MGFLDSYEPVEDRLREFWSDHPRGHIETSLVTPEAAQAGEVIIFRAEVYRENASLESPSSTGYAHQRILKEPPKKRNGEPNTDAPEWWAPWETCETSAIGRALANLGYAPKGKRPSREEMQKSGGDAAGTAPSDRSGEVAAESASSEHHFPVDPAKCDHKKSNGDWIKWVTTPFLGGERENVERCPKCGTPKLVAMEGTTADLGPA